MATTQTQPQTQPQPSPIHPSSATARWRAGKPYSGLLFALFLVLHLASVAGASLVGRATATRLPSLLGEPVSVRFLTFSLRTYPSAARGGGAPRPRGDGTAQPPVQG